MIKPAFAPHKIQQKQLQAIKKDIIVTDMEFAERFTANGLILPSDNGTSLGIRPRWGKVYAVGPDQQDVLVGQWVCVAHGRWTRGLDIEDETGKRTIRKIDPNDLLLVSDEKPMDMTMSSAIHVGKKPADQLHD